MTLGFLVLNFCMVGCNRVYSDKEEINCSLNEQEIAKLESNSWEKDERIQKAIENEKPTLVVLNERVKVGQTCIVPVYIVNNPGILGMSITVSYDEDKLSLMDAQNGDIFEGILELSKPEKLYSGCNLMWSGESISKEQVQDGLMMYLKFDIKKNNLEGKTPIILLTDQDGVYDNDLSIIQLEIDNGFVEIQK